MAVEDLVAQLRELGCADARVQGQFALFSFQVPIGARAGEVFLIGLPASDFPLNPPGGPHVQPGFDHPGGNNHGSELGDGWRYWSRPFPGWPQTDRSASAYLSHLRRLFSQVV